MPDFALLIIFSTALGVSFLLGLYIGARRGGTALSTTKKTEGEMEVMQQKAHVAVAKRTEDRKEEILEMMQEEKRRQAELANCLGEDVKEGVTRKSVERLLGVSETTANNYLNDLEKEGGIRQVGQSGRGVYYILAE